MQYIPEDGLYVYFRYDANQTVMCVMNTADKTLAVDFSKYSERTNGFAKAISVTDSKEYKTGNNTTIDAKSMWVLELKK